MPEDKKSSLERRGITKETLDFIVVSEEDRTMMHAGTPMEGRYRKSSKKLFKYTSEYETVRRRIIVEVEYLISLSEEMSKYNGNKPKIIDRVLTDDEKNTLRGLYNNFDDKSFMQFKKIEDKTQHDVVATTEWMKYKLSGTFNDFESIEKAIHAFLTSEDVNRNVHGTIMSGILQDVYLPMVFNFVEKIVEKCNTWEEHMRSDLEGILSSLQEKPADHVATQKESADKEWMEKMRYLYGERADFLLKEGASNGQVWAAKTHGRDAVPTKLSKVLMTTAKAIMTHVETDFKEAYFDKVASYRLKKMYGKLTGAVGNMNSLIAGYPDINWNKFAKAFVEDFGLKNYYMNDQCEPYIADVQVLSSARNISVLTMKQVNDQWLYIALNFMKKLVSKTSSGSSAMPQKANPWEKEGAMRYLRWANKDLDFLAEELPFYYMQGDMGRSILTRSIGIPFSKLLIAHDRIMGSLDKYEPDTKRVFEHVLAHPELGTETVQNMLRQYGITDAYDATKELSMGKDVTPAHYDAYLQTLVSSGRITEDTKYSIMEKLLNPNENLGDAIESVQKSKEYVTNSISWFRKEIERSKEATKIKINV